MPRTLLIPITTVIQAVADLTDGAASIPELLDALHGRYDCETMMMYDGTGYSLAESIDGSPLEENAGFNKRADLCSELFNCRYWRESTTISLSKFTDVSPHDILMTKADGLTLAMRLWKFFVPDQDFDHDQYKALTSKAKEPALSSDGNTPGYLDPRNSRYPPKLAGAVRAWEAVTDVKGKSPKQALDKWLREHAADFGPIAEDGNPVNQAIEECSKVANWSSGGAPKTPG